VAGHSPALREPSQGHLLPPGKNVLFCPAVMFRAASRPSVRPCLPASPHLTSPHLFAHLPAVSPVVLIHLGAPTGYWKPGNWSSGRKLISALIDGRQRKWGTLTMPPSLLWAPEQRLLPCLPLPYIRTAWWHPSATPKNMFTG
jgi:hypothetical protein